MKISLNTDAVNQLVSTSDMKLWLRLEDEITEDDILIDDLIISATQKIEKETNLTLITKAYDLYLDSINSKIFLPKPPLQRVNYFYYYNDDYDETEVDSDLYTVRTFAGTQKGYIFLKTSQVWPTYTSNGDGIKIIFTSGYGNDAVDVPNELITLCKNIVAHWYDNRESQELPEGAMDIINNYRRYNI